MSSFLLSIHLGVELLGHMVTLWWIIWRTARLFSKVTVLFYIPASSVWVCWFLHILANVCYYLTFKILAILMGISLWFGFEFPWWVMMSSIFVCAYWSFVYLPWRNVSSYPLPNFYFGFFFKLLSCICPLCILDSSLLSGISFANIFSYSVCCLFTFLVVSFEIQSFFILIKSNLPIFLLLLVLLVSYLRILRQMQNYEENTVYKSDNNSVNAADKFIFLWHLELSGP